MSNAIYKEYLSGHNKGLTLIEGQFTILSTQTADTANYKTSGLQGTGVKSVANQATGVYKVTLSGKFYKFLGFSHSDSGINDTANHVAIASLSNGVPYVITTVGTSTAADWTLAGLDSGVVPAVGVAMTAVTAASGSGGNGFASPVIVNGITKLQVYGDPNTTLNPAVGTDPYFYIQTLYDASSNIVAPAVPVDNTIIRFQLLVRNSSVKGKGE